jgi:hypothetical protein
MDWVLTAYVTKTCTPFRNTFCGRTAWINTRRTTHVSCLSGLIPPPPPHIHEYPLPTKQTADEMVIPTKNESNPNAVGNRYNHRRSRFNCVVNQSSVTILTQWTSEICADHVFESRRFLLQVRIQHFTHAIYKTNCACQDDHALLPTCDWEKEN